MTKVNKSYKAVPLEVSVQIRILHQECGYGIAKLQKKFPDFPKTTIYRHMKKSIGNIKPDKRKNSKGAPRKLNERNQRQIIRSMKTLMKDIGTFSSVDLQKHAGLAGTCSNRTVRRFLNKQNYGYYQCRRKGQSTPVDLVKRWVFAKNVNSCRKIFGKMVFHFIWMAQGLLIRQTRARVLEHIVPECGVKRAKGLRESTQRKVKKRVQGGE